jgi:hypothetical protein
MDDYETLIEQVKKSKKLILRKDKDIETKDNLISTYKTHLEKYKEENIHLKGVIQE